MGTLLLIVLVLLIIGSLPRWDHSRNWGYYPSGGLGTLAIILLVLVLMGYLPHRFRHAARPLARLRRCSSETPLSESTP